MFWPLVLHDPLYKTLFFDSWFRPPNAQNSLPKIAYKSACIAHRPMFGPHRGFRGCPIQLNHTECCAADPCCHGNEIWARRGDPVAYRLVHNASYSDQNWDVCPVKHQRGKHTFQALFLLLNCVARYSVVVRTSDLWARGCEFDYRRCTAG